MVCKVYFELNVVLNDAVHGNSDCNRLNNENLSLVSEKKRQYMQKSSNPYPNMRKERTQGALAIDFVVLCHNSNNRHGDTYEAVMIDTNPYDIEPRQAAVGCPPRALVSSTAFGEPVHWSHPGLYG